MSLLWAVLFGIIQGATEFLPVSSSAHLTILGAISGIKEDDALPFFIVLHLGTLFALLIFFAKDLTNLLKNVVKREKESVKIVLLIALTTFFTGVLGFGLKKFVEKAFASPLWACVFLLFTTLILFSVKFVQRKEIASIDSMTYFSAAIIGIAQGIAVFPGISRSGITIVSAMVVGLSRKDAFNYSFIASIPAIGGAFLVDLKDIKEVANSLGAEILLVGFIISFAVGYISLEFLRKSVIKGKLHLFGYYTLVVSLLGIIVFFFY